MYEKNAEFQPIEDIPEEVIEEENIYDHQTEGFLVLDESESNHPNSDTDEDSVASAQQKDGNIDAKDSAEVINDNDKSVTPIN